MHPKSQKLLDDIVDAGDFAQELVARKSLEDYLSDRQLRYSVERSFEVIGEATARLERIDPEVANQISSLRSIIGFRNRIAHGYDDINDEIVWATLRDSLPILINEVRSLLSERPAFGEG